jgi:hypothetical protein
VANDAERARPSRLTWRTDDTGAICGLSGHFWAPVRQGGHDEHTVRSRPAVGPHALASAGKPPALCAPGSPQFAASYQSIARRRGIKIANTAIARQLLTRAYHLLTDAASGGAPS